MLLRFVLALLLLARAATAQQDTSRRAAGAAISGVVHDSIAHKPLAGARVQLVTADHQTRFGRNAVSDADGRFTLEDVPDGEYMIGFFHAILDSLGLEPALHAVSVVDRRAVRVDLATPSAARLRAAICGSAPRPDSGGVVLGVVRDARDASPLGGITVIGEWFEYSFDRTGLKRRAPRVSATTRDNGWFVLCNLPSPGALGLSAGRGMDSTDVVDVQIPIEGFARRELYLGSARTSSVAVGDSATSRRMRLGDGRLSGVVVMAANGRPLAGAQVSIADGPQTRANENGEWMLDGAPSGTRVLEVRAVGYFPERRSVDVVEGAAPVRTSLLTMKAMLDTVRITESRRTLAGSGFEDRRRSSAGRFLTAADFARYQPIVTSDLFRMVPGVRVERVGMQRLVLLRGVFADWCTPAVYINGAFMSDLTADDIDDFVNPSEVAGVEFYTGTGVPPQFSRGMAGAGRFGANDEVNSCGSIIVWTKPDTSRNEWTTRKIVSAVSFVVLGIGVGALLMRR